MTQKIVAYLIQNGVRIEKSTLVDYIACRYYTSLKEWQEEKIEEYRKDEFKKSFIEKASNQILSEIKEWYKQNFEPSAEIIDDVEGYILLLKFHKHISDRTPLINMGLDTILEDTKDKFFTVVKNTIEGLD